MLGYGRDRAVRRLVREAEDGNPWLVSCFSKRQLFTIGTQCDRCSCLDAILCRGRPACRRVGPVAAGSQRRATNTLFPHVSQGTMSRVTGGGSRASISCGSGRGGSCAVKALLHGQAVGGFDFRKNRTSSGGVGEKARGRQTVEGSRRRGRGAYNMTQL